MFRKGSSIPKVTNRFMQDKARLFIPQEKRRLSFQRPEMVVINFSTSHNQKCCAFLDTCEVLIMLFSLKLSPIGFRQKKGKLFLRTCKSHICPPCPPSQYLAIAEKNVMKCDCFYVCWEDWQSCIWSLWEGQSRERHGNYHLLLFLQVGCCLQLGSPEVMSKPRLSTGISHLLAF